MHAAHERYNNPHLTFSLFEHVRNFSTLSYIFGCTMPAYNKLIVDLLELFS